MTSGPPRRRVLWWLSGGTLAVLLSGLGSAQVVQSPAQEVADRAAPPRSMLTSIVEQRVLVDTVVLRGTVGADTTVEISPPPVESGRAVVTAVRVEPGAEFQPGEVLLEVSGRPVFALAGELPAYRDLLPGMAGDDVTELQAALSELGYSTADADGEFGPLTKAALAGFYEELGYEPPLAGDQAALTAAEGAVRQAERALRTAQDTLDRLEEDPPPPVPGQGDPVPDAELQVAFAREDLDAARAARDEVERTSGAMLPLSEVVFLPTFPARVEQVGAEVGLDLTTGELEASLLTVSSGELVVRAQLNPAQRELLAEGMPVEILSELEGITAAGEITGIGELATDPANGTQAYPMVVAPVDEELDEQLAGGDVRLTVEAASTDEEVLVVPLSAVFAGADGRVSVLRVDPDGGQVRVVVTPGVSGDGYVAVTPIDGGLEPDDAVVVGAGGAP